jgi:hypothetical protein
MKYLENNVSDYSSNHSLLNVYTPDCVNFRKFDVFTESLFESAWGKFEYKIVGIILFGRRYQINDIKLVDWLRTTLCSLYSSNSDSNSQQEVR